MARPPGAASPTCNDANDTPISTRSVTDSTSSTLVGYTKPAGARKKKPPICPARLVLFCCNLFLGLILSQLIPEWMDAEGYSLWKHIIKVLTMLHVSYIMINVGFEFEIDKTNLKAYGTDYLVAMTAASFPWLFVSLYFMFALGDDHNVPWRMALLAGRFAAPTSAGILFTMLEAAGMKETWLFKKARILAIFDDLDTLLLMVPLKALIVGLKWELSIDLIWVVLLLVIMYRWLHAINIPATWWAVCLYAAAITTLCEMVHWVTTDPLVDADNLAETIHLEILLPAFTIGCIVKNPHSHHAVGAHGSVGPEGRQLERRSTFVRLKNLEQETFKFGVSAVFMVLVGLSMPSLFNESASAEASAHRRLSSISAAGDEDGGRALSAMSSGSDASASGSSVPVPPIPAGMLVLHVVMCSILMNVGKLFPAFCYRSQTNFHTRLALAIGMMPRGEVCAGIIVNAIALGASGTAITIAVLCLAVNMTCVSGFIFFVKHLAPPPSAATAPGKPEVLACASQARAHRGAAGQVVV